MLSNILSRLANCNGGLQPTRIGRTLKPSCYSRGDGFMSLTIARWTGLYIGGALALCAVLAYAQQRPAGAAAPPALPPRFFREEWQQIAPPANAGADFVAEGGVTPAAVTSPALELKLYDPDAASIAGYRANPPPR